MHSVIERMQPVDSPSQIPASFQPVGLSPSFPGVRPFTQLQDVKRGDFLHKKTFIHLMANSSDSGLLALRPQYVFSTGVLRHSLNVHVCSSCH